MVCPGRRARPAPHDVTEPVDLSVGAWPLWLRQRSRTLLQSITFRKMSGLKSTTLP